MEDKFDGRNQEGRRVRGRAASKPKRSKASSPIGKREALVPPIMRRHATAPSSAVFPHLTFAICLNQPPTAWYPPSQRRCSRPMGSCLAIAVSSALRSRLYAEVHSDQSRHRLHLYVRERLSPNATRSRPYGLRLRSHGLSPSRIQVVVLHDRVDDTPRPQPPSRLDLALGCPSGPSLTARACAEGFHCLTKLRINLVCDGRYSNQQ
jgi:hypothetical protein